MPSLVRDGPSLRPHVPVQALPQHAALRRARHTVCRVGTRCLVAQASCGSRSGGRRTRCSAGGRPTYRACWTWSRSRPSRSKRSPWCTGCPSASPTSSIGVAYQPAFRDSASERPQRRRTKRCCRFARECSASLVTPCACCGEMDDADELDGDSMSSTGSHLAVGVRLQSLGRRSDAGAVPGQVPMLRLTHLVHGFVSSGYNLTIFVSHLA